MPESERLLRQQLESAERVIAEQRSKIENLQAYKATQEELKERRGELRQRNSELVQCNRELVAIYQERDTEQRERINSLSARLRRMESLCRRYRQQQRRRRRHSVYRTGMVIQVMTVRRTCSYIDERYHMGEER